MIQPKEVATAATTKQTRWLLPVKLPPELDSGTADLLTRLRSFIVKPRRSPAIDGHHAALSNVIRPILATATEALVWPPMSKRDLVAYPQEILICDRGRHRFDLSKDVVSGYEPFWASSFSGMRGSIAIQLPRKFDNWRDVFKSCNDPAILSSRHQLTKSDSAGAIRYCDSVVDAGDSAILFSATDGVNLMSIFAPDGELEPLYQAAVENCSAH